MPKFNFIFKRCFFLYVLLVLRTIELTINFFGQPGRHIFLNDQSKYLIRKYFTICSGAFFFILGEPWARSHPRYSICLWKLQQCWVSSWLREITDANFEEMGRKWHTWIWTWRISLQNTWDETTNQISSMLLQSHFLLQEVII